MKKRFSAILICLFILVLFPVSALADNVDNEAVGTLNLKKRILIDLYDPIVRYVKFEVKNNETQEVYGTYILNEDNNWSYTIENIPSGTYVVTETEDVFEKIYEYTVYNRWENKTVTISSGGSSTVTCTNIYNYTEHPHTYTQKHDNISHWDECICKDIKNKEDHVYGEWETVNESTQTVKGEKKRTCSACGYIETDEIALLPKPDSSKTESPKTGDNSNILLLSALLFVSGGLIIVRCIYGKNKNNSVK